MKELLELKGIGIINLSILLHSIDPKEYPFYSRNLYKLLVYLGYFERAKNIQEIYYNYSDCLATLLKNHIETGEIDTENQGDVYTAVSYQIKDFEITDLLG